MFGWLKRLFWPEQLPKMFWLDRSGQRECFHCWLQQKDTSWRDGRGWE